VQATTDTSCLLLDGLGKRLEHRGVVAEGVLEHAGERGRRAVNPNDTKVHLEARIPLQVVLEGPDEVAADIRALLQGLTDGVDVVVQVLLAHGVVHGLLHVVLLPGQTVLRNVRRDVVVAVVREYEERKN